MVLQGPQEEYLRSVQFFLDAKLALARILYPGTTGEYGWRNLLCSELVTSKSCALYVASRDHDVLVVLHFS